MRASTNLPAHENWPCHCGSGECKAPATNSHDDGQGGDFFLCNEHQAEFEAMRQWIQQPGNAERLSAALVNVD